jgi:membrane protease YdiL (CAAX protease family)
MDKAVSKNALVIYLLLTVVFCTGPYVLMAHSEVRGGAGGYVTALMWGPALAAIVTTWLKKLDWGGLGFAWRHTPSCWAGYWLPIAYALTAYVLIWALGLGGFADPANIQAQAERLGWTITDKASFVPLYFVFVGVTGIILSTARGLGEELGWRGFMAPHLNTLFGFTGASVVTGVIWTLWHVPLIIFSDYNNGTPLLFGLTCFFIMIMNLSFIMHWLRLRSGSVWPAAILHGSHNLYIQTIFTPLTSDRGGMTAYAIDEFGFMIPLTSFVVALILWLKRDVAIAAHEARLAQGAQ